MTQKGALQRKRELCICITRFDLGGAQKIALQHAERADATRYNVTLLAGRGGVLDEEALALAKLPHTKTYLSRVLKHPLSALDPVALLRMTAFFKRRRFDVVHTHSSKAGALGRTAAALAGVPCIVHTVHGWSFTPEQSPRTQALYRNVERKLAPRCDRLITVSADNKREGLSHSIGRPHQYRVVYPAVDTERFYAPRVPREKTRAALGYNDSHFVVGSIANLKAQKGPMDFVEAAARVHQRLKHARFFFAGDGPMREEVQNAIDKKGLQDVITLLGWRQDPEDLMHAMDAFFLPSRFEGLPCTVVQAQCAGVPVVASLVNGTPEVVYERGDEITGLGVAAKDVEAMAQAIISLEKSPELGGQIARNAKNNIKNKFDIDTLVSAYEAIYDEVLEEK